MQRCRGFFVIFDVMNTENKSKLDYLKNPIKSLIREELVNYKLISDLKIEAAARKRYFKIYKPEIDFEGCDFIIEDDTDLSRKIQIKTRIGIKKGWNIRKSILLPGSFNQDDYNLTATFCPTYPGAFILVDVFEKNNELRFQYNYIDANIIYLKAYGFIKVNKQSQQKSQGLLRLMDDPRVDSLMITNGQMIKLKTLKSLIFFLGIFQELDFSNNAWKAIQIQNRPRKHFLNNNFSQEIKEEQISWRLIRINEILKEHAIGF